MHGVRMCDDYRVIYILAHNFVQSFASMFATFICLYEYETMHMVKFIADQIDNMLQCCCAAIAGGVAASSVHVYCTRIYGKCD
jgi:hypothetical protein